MKNKKTIRPSEERCLYCLIRNDKKIMKVGMARVPADRMCDLNYACENKFKIFAIIPINEIAIEQTVLREFRNFRIGNSEYFDINYENNLSKIKSILLRYSEMRDCNYYDSDFKRHGADKLPDPDIFYDSKTINEEEMIKFIKGGVEDEKSH